MPWQNIVICRFDLWLMILFLLGNQNIIETMFWFSTAIFSLDKKKLTGNHLIIVVERKKKMNWVVSKIWSGFARKPFRSCIIPSIPKLCRKKKIQFSTTAFEHVRICCMFYSVFLYVILISMFMLFMYEYYIDL